MISFLETDLHSAPCRAQVNTYLGATLHDAAFSTIPIGLVLQHVQQLNLCNVGTLLSLKSH